MSFDTSIIKIGWKMEKLWAFEGSNMAVCKYSNAHNFNVFQPI